VVRLGEGELAGDLEVDVAVVVVTGGAVVPVGLAWLGVVVAVGVDIVGQGGVVDPGCQPLLVGSVQQAQVVDAGRWRGSGVWLFGAGLGWAWRPIRNATAVPNERCWWRTSMSVRSKGSKTSSTLRPTSSGSTW